MPEIAAKALRKAIAEWSGGHNPPPTLRLCTWVTEDGNESLALPDTVRHKWMEHAMYGEQWRNAIKAFNKATKALQPGPSNAANTATVAEDEVTDEDGWAMMSEADIRSQNDIAKVITSDFLHIVYLVTSSRKLFAVARRRMCSATALVIGRSPPNARLLSSEDSEQCVLEMPEGGHIAEDTDATSWEVSCVTWR